MSTPIEMSLLRFDPAVRPPAPLPGDVGYVIEETAVGRLLLGARPDGTLVTCAYVPDDGSADRLLDRVAAAVSPRVLRGGAALDPARRQLDEYLGGRRRSFDLAVDLALATPFQQLVLDRLPAFVGYGRTAGYGDLARALGRPSAARAVGSALGANPLCVVLPCHRIVASSGALTGYAGGLEAKRLLLDLEKSRAL